MDLPAQPRCRWDGGRARGVHVHVLSREPVSRQSYNSPQQWTLTDPTRARKRGSGDIGELSLVTSRRAAGPGFDPWASASTVLLSSEPFVGHTWQRTLSRLHTESKRGVHATALPACHVPAHLGLTYRSRLTPDAAPERRRSRRRPLSRRDRQTARPGYGQSESAPSSAGSWRLSVKTQDVGEAVR